MDADPSPGDLLASHAHNGVLTKKGWFDWRERYFELRGKKLSYFKSAKDGRNTPSGILFLHKTVTTIETDIPTSKYGKRHCFLLHTTKKNEPVTHYLAAPSEETKEEWVKKITWAIEFDDPNHSDAEKEPDRGPPPSEISWKNKLLSKVATSGVGKKIIKSFVSEDAILVIELISRVLKKLHPHDKKIADSFEQTLLRTAVDVIFLIDDKVISKDEVLMTRDPVFRLWSDVLDMLEISFVFDEERVIESMEFVESALKAHIIPALATEEKRNAILAFRDYFIDHKLVAQFYTGDAFEEERQNLRKILRAVWERTFMLEKQGGEYK